MYLTDVIIILAINNYLVISKKQIIHQTDKLFHFYDIIITHL